LIGKKNDANGEMQSRSSFISLTMRITHQQNSTKRQAGFKARSSPLNLHAVRQESTRLPVAGRVADAVLSNRFKSETMNLIQSKHIFTSIYIAKTTFIFNDTF
jgi:hypothetical protein